MGSPGFRSTARTQLWVWSLPQSFSIYPGYLSELAGGVHQSDFRITILDCCWGTHFITVKMWIPCWNFIGLRQWFTRSRRPNQEYSLKFFEPLLRCPGPASAGARMLTKFGKVVSGVMNLIVLSPALIDHSLGEWLIALGSKPGNVICLFDAYISHLHAQILGWAEAYMVFVPDGTMLAYYSPDFGLKIWDLTTEYWHCTHGYDLM